MLSRPLSRKPQHTPSTTSNIHIPAQIRRPRKVLYLVAFFGLLYWFSIRHGLGQERNLENHAEHLGIPAPLPGTGARRPIGAAVQVGKGGGAGGIWEGALSGLGLPRGGKKKTVDHTIREDGYVEVGTGGTGEHPICESRSLFFSHSSSSLSLTRSSVFSLLSFSLAHVALELFLFYALFLFLFLSLSSSPSLSIMLSSFFTLSLPLFFSLHFTLSSTLSFTTTTTTNPPPDDLMTQARIKFDTLLSRQSRTLKEAVAEYKRRYGLPPPKGFEAWWKFVVDKDVKIVDDVSSA
jgi:hypothetical protein